ncbi:phage antirepressor N-terminal domain-containing protein [Tolumonas lignilytica]|uniref:phage antirepressor N-terminal domain-containing protein n=1 Tax=Tolumonas lignilytica TaxID=1283284 RepID=UPI000688D1F5|nr:phage antirepressor N-terminal domain-containing protein [Tolumonas lignilytica]
MVSITKVTNNSSTGIVVDSESGSISNNAIVVPFHGTELLLAPFNGEPYVPMKPVVEGMGLAWSVQHRKIQAKFGSTITEMVIVAEDGKNREMSCLALRKLTAWLYSVNPNKVAPEIKAKVIQYQEECDEVLWQYWTKGSVTKESVVKAQKPIREHASKSYLPEFRKAKAMKMSMEAMDLCLKYTNLSPESKQTCVAMVVNDIAGFEAIPLPRIEEHYHTAKEVGDMLGCSANKIGKVANEHGLKTDEYGKFFLDKSPFSAKQVEAFRYNANGVSALKHIIVGEDAA